MGVAIFKFSQKIGLKTTKTVRFCILHKPMGGGARAPPGPPLATLLLVRATFTGEKLLRAKCNFTKIQLQKIASLLYKNQCSLWPVFWVSVPKSK